MDEENEDIFRDVIFTVTAGHVADNKWRCWAWFSTFEEAERAVQGCGDFLWDGYYEDLVIEEVPRGAITPEYREWWYSWDGHEWRSSTKPQSVDRLFHFGVG